MSAGHASLNAALPPIVVEALRLAGRIKDRYPSPLEREEAQDALVELAAFVDEYVADLNDALLPLAESIIERSGELSLGPLPDDVIETVGLLQADADTFRYEFEQRVWKPAQEADRRV